MNPVSIGIEAVATKATRETSAKFKGKHLSRSATSLERDFGTGILM